MVKVSKEIEKIAAKIFNSNRISEKECIKLLKSKRFDEIAYHANYIREKKYKNITTYAINRHINYSNICQNDCLFCAFRKDKNSKEAKRLKVEEILKIIDEIKHFKNVEIHITGGLDPQFTFKDALSLVKKVKEIKSKAIIKAFTMVEIDFFAKNEGVDESKIMSKLKESGVSSFPGGGAEIFSDRIRKKICPSKINSDRWLELSRKAHKLGIPTNATMLYGIGETSEEIVDHLKRLRTLQDETNGFMSFIPLLFQKENTALKNLKAISLVEQLKIYAVSRLFLDNIAHIKNHWAMAGLKSAELSQWCGVDDLEGTLFEERIGHEGGAKTPIGMKKEEIVKIIKSAGRTPAERDGLYNIIKKDGAECPPHSD
ncbi:MAG: CofH family radical SAM protein [Acidobacteria bacterium]|nr:CofH family radical SAM protein [Acidobacteriota bacterium]